ncbi:4-hydroxybenzoate 3-monooxygenase [Modestobacter lapidis]|nr:4-hydroxybenzoate 3-monooxygenase [Modestobacter lapidis]
MPARTQVAVLGAGPAGLVLAALLAREGVDCVVLELRSRSHVESRVRAGALEPGTVALLRELGVGERLDATAMVSHQFELRIDGERHVLPVTELSGQPMYVYGQQEVVADLVAHRLAAGHPLLFEAEALAVEGIAGAAPTVRYRYEGVERTLTADVVVGADGFHGVGRRTVAAARVFTRDYPIAWLGLLVDAPPSGRDVVYAFSRSGLGMHSMRSPTLTRLYLQVPATDTFADWPEDRIWAQLHTRLSAEGWSLTEGPVLERAIAPLRAYVSDTMRAGRLFLAGDAAHIVPPTGAKGLNLAVRDVRVLAPALVALLRGDPALADAYTATCLQHVWWAMSFSCGMARLLHASGDPFEDSLRAAELRGLATREPGRRMLAEDYCGVRP